MTQSIFDPNSSQTEHSGNQNMGPRADDISNMPADVTDGQTEDDKPVENDDVNAPGLVDANKEKSAQGLAARMGDALDVPGSPDVQQAHATRQDNPDQI